MDIYQIITLIVTGLSLSTITGFIWKNIYNKRKRKKDHIDQLLEEEEAKNLRSVIREELQPTNEKIDAIGKGTLSGLRNDILNCYYACYSKGYRTDEDTINIYDLNEAYKDLKGNSFIEDVIKRFDKLPTEEQYQALHKNGGEDTDGEE